MFQQGLADENHLPTLCTMAHSMEKMMKTFAKGMAMSGAERSVPSSSINNFGPVVRLGLINQ
eukprot:1081448-Karenia_brevis.AAC.1